MKVPIEVVGEEMFSDNGMEWAALLGSGSKITAFNDALAQWLEVWEGRCLSEVWPQCFITPLQWEYY